MRQQISLDKGRYAGKELLPHLIPYLGNIKQVWIIQKVGKRGADN